MAVIVGGIIGYVIGGPIGAAIGVIIGFASYGNSNNNINNSSNQNINKEKETEGIDVICPYCDGRVTVKHEGEWICPYCKKEFVYGETEYLKSQRLCFSMYAKFSKLQGNITGEHIEVIENLIKNEYEYSEDERKKAISYFRTAKDDNKSIEYYSNEFKTSIDKIQNKTEREEIFIVIINHLYMIGNRSGSISNLEIEYIEKVARIFELNEIIVQSILEEKISKKNKIYGYYEILNCKYGEDFQIVKKNYKKLAREYHPDRIESAAIPEYLKEHSYKKFREIQEAYEYIKSRN